MATKAPEAPQAQPEAEAPVQTEPEAPSQAGPDAEARVQAPGQDAPPPPESAAPQAGEGEPAQEGREPEPVQAQRQALDGRAFLNRVNELADAIGAGRRPDRILDNVPEEQRDLLLVTARRLVEERQRAEQLARQQAVQQAELLAYERQQFAEFDRLNALASRDPERAKSEDEVSQILDARDELLRLIQQDPDLFRRYQQSKQQAQVTPALRQQVSAEIAQGTMQAVLAASREVLPDLPDEEFAALWNEAAQLAVQSGGGPAAGFGHVMQKVADLKVEAAVKPLKEQLAEKDARIEALERQLQGLSVERTGAPDGGSGNTKPTLDGLTPTELFKLHLRTKSYAGRAS